MASTVGLMLAGGCSAQLGTGADTTTAPRTVDIGKVLSLKPTFGPDFEVITAGPTGIDPKLLAPQKLPEGIGFEPAVCGEYATRQTLPSGVHGNMAAVIATGQGNRFIAIALETSETVSLNPPAENCRHITFSGPNMAGTIDVVDAPRIDGAQTIGTRRVLEATVAGATGAGQLYTFVAYLGRYQVIVTADPLIAPNQPVAAVNVPRAQQVFTDVVAAVRS